VDRPAAGLAELNDLNLGGYYLFHAIRADLFRRLERDADAAAAYDAAIRLAGNNTERVFLQHRRQQLTSPEETQCD
jgi:RNA polymerase sigma-70 factor, ECF subfamily